LAASDTRPEPIVEETPPQPGSDEPSPPSAPHSPGYLTKWDYTEEEWRGPEPVVICAKFETKQDAYEYAKTYAKENKIDIGLVRFSGLLHGVFCVYELDKDGEITATVHTGNRKRTFVGRWFDAFLKDLRDKK
jgi:hypothetical protein